MAAQDGPSDERRFALLLPDLSGGGAERVALALIRGFMERGHPVDLLLVRRVGELLPLIPDGVTVVELGGGSLRGALWPLVRYLLRRRPHAVHAMMWPLTVIAVVARMVARTRTRLVLSDHIALSRQYGDDKRTMRMLRWTVRYLYPRADARVLVSSDAADDLATIGGVPRETIDVIYNPLDLPADAVRDPGAVEWGGGGARILTVGVLKEQKNHALLLTALARVRARRRATLMIVGDGSLRATLERLAAELGVADDVIFAGYQIDPWPWLGSADIFVLSSNYEGFGNVLVEALHAGLPVVSTDCESGPREILADGRFGTLVPCGDPDALAAAIETALDRPFDATTARARAQALSGRSAVEQHLATMLG